MYRALYNRDMRRYPVLLGLVMKNPLQAKTQSLMDKYFQLWNALSVHWKFRAVEILEPLLDSLPEIVLCPYPMLNDDFIAYIASIRVCLDNALIDVKN